MTEAALAASQTSQSLDAEGAFGEQSLRFRDQLFEAGLLHPTGVDGIYGRSGGYEGVVSALQAAVTRLGQGRFEPVSFPPVLSRAVFDRTGYLRSFPDLMGSVHVFRGDDRTHAELIRRYEEGGPWPELLEPGEVVLCSAACHAVYPLCTGVLPPGGRQFEIAGYCFRNEPSSDPARMRSFRMHELVWIGEPEATLAHRQTLFAAGLQLLSDIGLEMNAVVANDPFFGRLGAILAQSQLEEAAKIEGVTPICSAELPTAVISGNYAGDHFGVPFSINTVDGQAAHSSCVGFGVDRITLALLRRHGLEPERWPSRVRALLWP